MEWLNTGQRIQKYSIDVWDGTGGRPSPSPRLSDIRRSISSHRSPPAACGSIFSPAPTALPFASSRSITLNRAGNRSKVRSGVFQSATPPRRSDVCDRAVRSLAIPTMQIVIAVRRSPGEERVPAVVEGDDYAEEAWFCSANLCAALFRSRAALPREPLPTKAAGPISRA